MGNALFTWPLEAVELGRTLEEPADRSLELLDRQGFQCVTAETPAVAVLCPLGARAPVAVVLANGRLVYRELERNGTKAEYAAQLESGERVTAATWEVVGGEGPEEGEVQVRPSIPISLLYRGRRSRPHTVNICEAYHPWGPLLRPSRPQVMAFLGTSHGRVYRVGPLGSAAGSASGIASGPMHKPQGLADYLPWRIRGGLPVVGWIRQSARHGLTIHPSIHSSHPPG